MFVRIAIVDISWSNAWGSASGVLLRKAVTRMEQSEMRGENLGMSGSFEGELVRSASRRYLSVTASRACRIVLLLVWCCRSFCSVYSAWRLGKVGMLLPSRVCGRFVGAILVIRRVG